MLVVQLGEERKEDLDATDGVDGAVDGVRHDGLDVLWLGHNFFKPVRFQYIYRFPYSDVKRKMSNALPNCRWRYTKLKVYG